MKDSSPKTGDFKKEMNTRRKDERIQAKRGV